MGERLISLQAHASHVPPEALDMDEVLNLQKRVYDMKRSSMYGEEIEDGAFSWRISTRVTLPHGWGKP